MTNCDAEGVDVVLSKRSVFGIVLFLVTPIVINYALLSWRAPGVNGDEGDWLGFFANFVGVIGAVAIAIFQFRKQRELDRERDIEQNRSYVDIQDFSGPMMLVDVKTHENSRIISTEGYEHLKKALPRTNYKGSEIPYLKISHYGTAPIITRCNIEVEYIYQQNGIRKPDTVNYFLASIEQGVEIYIPLVPVGSDENSTIDMVSLTFEYVTLKGERLKLVRKYNSITETLFGEKNEIIYSEELQAANWIYPNKINNSK